VGNLRNEWSPYRVIMVRADNRRASGLNDFHPEKVSLLPVSPQCSAAHLSKIRYKVTSAPSRWRFISVGSGNDAELFYMLKDHLDVTSPCGRCIGCVIQYQSVEY
jgi:hypothetical protein